MKAKVLFEKLRELIEEQGDDIEVGFKFFFKDYDITLSEKNGTHDNYDIYISPTVMKYGKELSYDSDKISFEHHYNIGDEFVVIKDGIAIVDEVKYVYFRTDKNKPEYRGYRWNGDYTEEQMTPTSKEKHTYKVEVYPYYSKGQKVYLESQKEYGEIEGFQYTKYPKGDELICCLVRIENGPNQGLWVSNEKGLMLYEHNIEK